MPAFEAAVAAFVAGTFAEAAARFAAVSAADPDDGAARYLRERALALETAGGAWEGVDSAAK